MIKNNKKINEAYYIEKFLIMPTDEFVETD